MTTVPPGWQIAVAIEDMPLSGIYEAILGPRQMVVIVRAGGEFIALEGLCPHQMARLGRGMLIDDCWIQCPHHLARFRLSDGVCGPGWVLPPLERYATRIENGHVLLPDPLVALNDC